jgi:E3 ubiquitin-protein ligase BRE1
LKSRLQAYQARFDESFLKDELNASSLDILKEREFQIIELRQRLVDLQKLAYATQDSTPNKQSSEPKEAASIEQLVKTEIRRLRELLREGEQSLGLLNRQKEQLLGELEDERRRKVDGRFERQYRAAVEDLKSSTEAMERMRGEFEGVIRSKNKELEDMRRAILESGDQFEAHAQLLDKDIRRLRKERDSSRESYELLNGQCATQNKIIEDLKRALGSLRTENEFLKRHPTDNEELTALYEAFEGLEKQISDVISSSAQRSDEVNRHKNEKLKLEFEHAQAARQLELANAKMKVGLNAATSNLQTSIERENQLSEKIKSLEDKLLSHQKKMEEPAPSSSSIPTPMMEVSGRDSSVAEIKALSAENQNLSRELQTCREQLDAMYLSGGVNVADLREQIELYRKLLKCNSCKTRDKNAVITRCMHVFCRDCLETRIETRQRKCPNCGEPFGASDIKNIFL